MVSANSIALRRALKVITKLPHKRKASFCAPRKEPTPWQPKHIAATKEAMKLFIDGVGLRSAPFTVTAEGYWQNKVFCSDIAQRILYKTSERAAEATAKKSISIFALIVASLAARIVESAVALKAKDASFRDAEIGMQKATQDAGWDKVKTKGSGVVFNDAGRALFERAVACVSVRVEAM